MGMDQHLIMKDPMKYHSERATLAIAINQMHRFMNNVGMLNIWLEDGIWWLWTRFYIPKNKIRD